MTTALGIAGVTATLVDLLNDGVANANFVPMTGPVTVTARAPTLVHAEAGAAPCLNVFLYLVTPNAAYRNAELPERDENGRRLTNPPLALNLHYLLTAYAQVDFHAEVLLGYGMDILHANAVLPRELIRAALPPALQAAPAASFPANLRALGTSELADQIELVKVTPEYLNTDEMSKLWAAFQAPYRPTAAYQASVVLLQRRAPVRTALPVRTFALMALASAGPRIDEAAPVVEGTPRPGRPIVAGDTIALLGSGLAQPNLSLSVDGVPIGVGQFVVVSGARIDLTTTLASGTHGVVARVPPPFEHPTMPGSSSEPRAFVVRPKIVVPPQPVRVGDSLTLRVAPAISAGQRVELVVDALPSGGPSRVVELPPQPNGTADLSVPLPALAAGRHLLRVRVDGAESLLEAAPGGGYAPSVVW